MTRNTVIIAIDGPSGAGKGTVSAYLANKFNLKYLDTGLLYRALAAKALEGNVAAEDAEKLTELAVTVTADDTNLGNLRTEAVAAMASKIAAHPDVRQILNQVQRDFAYADPSPHKGVILDGRDIGTVICPDADCKFYLTACPTVRAQRRTLESDAATDQKTVKQMMAERDQRDSGRQHAPLTTAADAIILDTTDLPIDEACSITAQYVEKFFSK